VYKLTIIIVIIIISDLQLGRPYAVSYSFIHDLMVYQLFTHCFVNFVKIYKQMH